MRFETSLPAVPASVPQARRVLEPLEGEVEEIAYRNALLLTTELVTNVVRHVGAGDVQLSFQREDGLLRISVTDQGQGFEPGPVPKAKERESGWGLHLLQKASTRWGTIHDGGFTVWFELQV